MKNILTLAIVLFSAFTVVKAQSDNPCGAPTLPVNAGCTYQTGTSVGATSTAGVPAPGCAFYSGNDVWYAVTVPASGTLMVTVDVAPGGPTDMGMAFYSGACGSLSLLECDDDDGPGLMPMITYGGLTPGATVYVRVWRYGGGTGGPFLICAQAGAASTPCTPTGANGTCAGATAFCTSPVPTVYCNSTGVPSLGGGGIYGCLGSTPNPAFYYLHIDSPGAIDILIQQNSSSGSPIDVDFVLWGPFATQAAMCPGMTAANIVDCSYSALATETANIPASATTGQWYLLLVTNFSGTSGSISYTQTGGTGSTDCSITMPCSVTAVPTHIACFGGTGSISTTVSGSGPYTVDVVNAAGTTVATQTGAGTTYNFTGLPGGTYTINLSAAGSSPACTNSTTATINAPAAALSASSTHTDALCSGGCTGTLSASATGGTSPYSFSWSGGLGTGANKVSVCPGTYTVTVTDANGCTSTSTQTVLDNTDIVVTTDGTSPTCTGASTGSVNATSTGGTGTHSYLWSGGLGAGASHTNIPAGTYTVTVTDDNGCSQTASVTLVDPPLLVFNAPAVTHLLCNNVCSDGVIDASASVSGGTGGYTYSISPALPGTGPVYTNVCAGNYTLTVTDDNGCQAIQSITVNQPLPLNIAMSSVNTSCVTPNGSVTAIVSGGTPAYTYFWPASPGVTTNVNSNLVVGTYIVQVTDANGCTISGSADVGANDPLVINLTTSQPAICQGESTTLTAVASGGSGGPYTFFWQENTVPAVPISTDVSSGTSTITVNPVNPLTSYLVTVDDGCSATAQQATVDIAVNPSPQVAFSTPLSAGCTPFTMDLQVMTDIGVSFVYDFTCDGIPDLNSEMPTATYTYTSPGTYSVCVTAISADGCSSSASIANMVTSYPTPVAGFVATPMTANILTPTINFTSISTGASHFTWDFDDSTGCSGPAGSSANGLYTTGMIQQPEHVYQDTGHYAVTLTVENIYGCIHQVTHPVVIEPDYEFFMPNSFTPNGDGLNDVFMPKGIGMDVDRYEFYVFDRWGQVIFKGTTLDSFWDGTMNGLKCKPDTYVWKVVLVDFKNIKHSYTGAVNLLR